MLDGEAVEKLVEQVLYAARAEFSACGFERGTVVEFAVGLGHPFAGLLAIVPNVFGVSEYAGEALCALAFIDGEAPGAALPGRLRDDLEFIGAGDAAVIVKASRKFFEGTFRQTGGDGRLEFRDGPDGWAESEDFSDGLGFDHGEMPLAQYSSIYGSRGLRQECLCVVARAGVQPATFALGVRCSMQLSYRATYA